MVVENTNPSDFTLIATCAFGLEAPVKWELKELGYEARVISPGKVGFRGNYEAIAKTNLWLRVADRVLVEISRFDAPDFDTLFDTVKELDWDQWLSNDSRFPVTGRSRNSQLTSVPAIQRSVKRAVVESLKRIYRTDVLPESGVEYKLDVALLDNVASITIDTTGPSLHKRGYRKLVGSAPIKETLAAAMIVLSVWKPERPLLDPFCGSGTIPIEAALLGLNIAPGLHRDFSAKHWPQIDAKIWEEQIAQAVGSIRRDQELQIVGTDIDAEVLKLARQHAELAGVAEHVHFQQRSFEDLRSKRKYGCLITNPPYGKRLAEERQLKKLYRTMPGIFQRLPTWSHFIITSMPQFERLIQKSATRRRKLYNGRIECMYFQYLGPRPPRPTPLTGDKKHVPGFAVDSEIENVDEPLKQVDESNATPDLSPAFGGLNNKDHEQAELFATRLKKRARHFRRWPKKGITCYRLYERDIPELPFVVDRYENFFHITEYERPHDRLLDRHAGWLELMKKTVAKTFEVPIQNVILKSRVRQSGKSQYEKMGGNRKRLQVQENGLTFEVNLTDYVDTGLFLDHRQTRSMIREEADGKRFLNLFAYTGSFSVYAAAGGAESTCTVDWSNTYLDWARANLRINGFDGDEHKFVNQNSRQFVHELKKDQFDLIVVDPPTFSNSKRTSEVWDVQRDHADFLNELFDPLSKGGTIYFSTNFRKFDLNEAQLDRFQIIEISRQTVPEDFRNKKIHRCWKLIKE